MISCFFPFAFSDRHSNERHHHPENRSGERLPIGRHRHPGTGIQRDRPGDCPCEVRAVITAEIEERNPMAWTTNTTPSQIDIFFLYLRFMVCSDGCLAIKNKEASRTQSRVQDLRHHRRSTCRRRSAQRQHTDSPIEYRLYTPASIRHRLPSRISRPQWRIAE